MVTAPTPWEGGLVAISSFGFGGSNVHCLVAGRVRPKGDQIMTLQPAEPHAVAGTIKEEDAPELKIDPEVRSWCMAMTVTCLFMPLPSSPY